MCSGEQQCFQFDFILAQLSTLTFEAELDHLLIPSLFIPLPCNQGCHFIMSDSISLLKKEREEGGKEESKEGRQGGMEGGRKVY